MSSKNNKEVQNESIKRSPLFADNDIKYNLLKDFKVQVTQFDFLTQKEDVHNNFGIFDNVISLMYKNNKKIYYLKIIEKKNLINK